MRTTLLAILLVLLMILGEISEIRNNPLSGLELFLLVALVFLPAELALLADYVGKKKESGK